MAKRKDTDAKSAAPSGESIASAPAVEMKAAAPIIEATIEPKIETKLEPTLETKSELPSIEGPKLAAVETASIEPTKIEPAKIEPTKIEALKVEVPKAEAPKGEVVKLKAVKSDSPKTFALKSEAPRLDWIKPLMAEDASAPPRPSHASVAPEPAAAPAAKPGPSSRFALLAASVAIVAGIGAMAGALGASSFSHMTATPLIETTASVPAVAADDIHALQASIAQLRGDLAALKTSVEAGTKSASGQFAKVAERMDRVERAQAEPTAKITKAVESLERLEKRAEATPAKDVTGSVPTSATSASASQPVVGGWVVRNVYQGVAFIQGRIGLMEVEAGDVVPGVGRVESIRKQDGRWVVVTSKGIITSPR